MGTQGKTAGNSYVCIEIRSWLFLKLYICDFRFRKAFFASQRCDNQNLACIEVLKKYLYSFLKKIRYILSKLAMQKIQGMYGEYIFTS